MRSILFPTSISQKNMFGTPQNMLETPLWVTASTFPPFGSGYIPLQRSTAHRLLTPHLTPPHLSHQILEYSNIILHLLHLKVEILSPDPLHPKEPGKPLMEAQVLHLLRITASDMKNSGHSSTASLGGNSVASGDE